MLITIFCMEYVTNSEPQNFFGPVFTNMHVHLPIQHDEYFRPVIYVPFVGCISPMKPHARTFDPFDVTCIPCV